MAQHNLKRGSVVLVRYPFTDLTALKVRPALVLSPYELMCKSGDVLCLFISSATRKELLSTDFLLDNTHQSFSGTGLKFSSVFRAHKLALLHKSLIVRVLGEMEEALMAEINQRLKIALGL